MHSAPIYVNDFCLARTKWSPRALEDAIAVAKLSPSSGHKAKYSRNNALYFEHPWRHQRIHATLLSLLQVMNKHIDMLMINIIRWIGLLHRLTKIWCNRYRFIKCSSDEHMFSYTGDYLAQPTTRWCCSVDDVTFQKHSPNRLELPCK